MFTISSTTLTFESSRKPWASVPSPSEPGVAGRRIAGRDRRREDVAAARLHAGGVLELRQLDRADLLRIASCRDVTADTMPSFEIVTVVALAGIVIAGSSW